jgi:hypothetical protein
MSRFVLVATIVAAYAVEAAHAQAAFLSDMEDVPLAPGLVELAEGSSTFPGRDGWVLSAVARGKAAPETVAAFYREALPALGWGAMPGEDLAFIRGREKLRLGLDPIAPAELEVRYTLVAAPPSRILE